MTVSIRRVSLGAGYEYLLASVARGDGAVGGGSPLTRYYTESGSPPGRFLGTGLAGLADGAGIAEGTQVSEEALFRMLGMLADPVTGEPLGRRPRRWPAPLGERIAARVAALPAAVDAAERAARIAAVEAEERDRERRLARPVAGFDLTFSVPKSVSAAWALADGATQAVIHKAHCDAIRAALRHAERNIFCSRSGTNGAVQEDVRGVIAAEFDHWDSRAGDPHLHTHVVVLNRVQTTDGRWRTLDSRTLFKYVVALSELHEGVLQDLLTMRLGWAWDERARAHSPVRRHDVCGVPDALIGEFSRRSRDIEQAKNHLVEDFVAAHGRQPTDREVLQLRQQATLSTRPDKQHRSLAEQVTSWRTRAHPFVGGDTVGWADALRDRCALPPLHDGDLRPETLRDAALIILNTVAERRATFTHANVLAEAHRQLHGVRFASPLTRLAVADRVTTMALDQALLLTAPTPKTAIAAEQLSRGSGASASRHRAADIYTTRELLAAEERLLAAGRDISGPAAPVDVKVDIAGAPLAGRGHHLGADQAAAITAITDSARVLDLLVGPAGAGKTAALAGLTAAWEHAHGPGTVVGLAPSAAAAQVLGDELGIDADNTAKWLVEHDRDPERAHQIDQLRARLAGSCNPGSTLARQLARLEADRARWTLRPGQLVIIDEASLAGTHTLDRIVTHAGAHGAKVLLAGDWAQLGAIGAGGAFAMLVADRDDVPELSDVRRFSHAWEREASVQLRAGDPTAIDAYRAHGRIAHGDRDAMLDSLYAAWRADVAAGRTALMLAADTATVDDLNHRARTDRIRAGQVIGNGVPISCGSTASAGDQIITRRNDRRLTTGQRWVKNGDTFTVHAVHADGSLTVHRTGNGIAVHLPAGYVRNHVELGYAATAYRAQGRTVDTAHVLISEATSREVLYVAATRGRHANHLYLDTRYDPDPDTSHETADNRDFDDVLRAVLANTGTDSAAHTVLRREALRGQTQTSVGGPSADVIGRDQTLEAPEPEAIAGPSL